MVRTFLKVYMELGYFFVSERTKKSAMDLRSPDFCLLKISA